jgi:hypothetical protein
MFSWKIAVIIKYIKCFVAQLLANPWTRCTWLSYTGNEVLYDKKRTCDNIYKCPSSGSKKKYVRQLIPQPGLRTKNSHGVLYFRTGSGLTEK